MGLNIPGLPALLNPSAMIGAAVSFLTADAAFFPSLLLRQWGIFLGGFPVVVADTVTSLEYRQEWIDASFPVEQGSFESYDKVALPFNARVQFAAGGSEIARQALLDSIAAIAGTLTLYTVVTPERVYPSCNVVRYDYRRTAVNGVGMILVDVMLLEIRVAAPAQGLSDTQAPSGADPVNGGTVQATAPTANQQAAFGFASGPV